MILRTVIPLILIAMALVGCAVPKYNYMPVRTEISEPPLNTVNVAYVGDALLRQGSYAEHDAIFLPMNTNISWAYTALRGYYLKIGEDEESEFYLPGGPESGNIIKAGLADPWQSLEAYKDEQKLCIVTVFNVHTCEEAPFERVKRPILNRNSFQQTSIYSGKVGNKLNIGYREFSNDIARPAFNNSVEYDLSDSRMIGYKGARLEVIEATNEYLKYRVLKNFNQARY